MYTYHYSVKFKDEEILCHGDFNTSFVDTEKIVNKARSHLSAKLKNFWKKSEDIVAIEIYDNKREIIFKWEK